MLIGQASLNSFVLRRLLPLGGLLLVSVVALWSAVMFFQGEIDVITGTQTFNLLLAQPNGFARENQTQLAYLILNVTLVYDLGHKRAAERGVGKECTSKWKTGGWAIKKKK